MRNFPKTCSLEPGTARTRLSGCCWGRPGFCGSRCGSSSHRNLL